MPTDDDLRPDGPADLGSVDDQLRVLVRLWRWDRIDGLKAAARRELAAVDRLLDRRLELTRARRACAHAQQTTDLEHRGVDDHGAADRAPNGPVDDHGAGGSDQPGIDRAAPGSSDTGGQVAPGAPLLGRPAQPSHGG